MKIPALVLLALFSLSSQLALASNEGGHGGGAIICGNADSTIHSAELLDLWEKRHAQDGSSISPNNQSESVQLEAALAKFEAISPLDVKNMRKILATLVTQNIADDQQLMPPPDTGLHSIRKVQGCALQSLQGVADFNDRTGILTVDPEILAAMGPTDRAALKFHEALYKAWRSPPLSVLNSLAVRKMTGLAFADQPFEPIAADADRAIAKYECFGGDQYRFLVIERPGLATELQFSQYAGRPVIGKTSVFVETKNQMWEDGDPSTQLATPSLQARFHDGFTRFTYRAPHNLANPVYYPGLPYNYRAAFGVSSKYDPLQAMRILGQDSYLKQGDFRDVVVNDWFKIYPVSEHGMDFQWYGALKCQKP